MRARAQCRLLRRRLARPAQRRARNPVTGELIPLVGANAGLVGAIVPNSGDANNGLALGIDPNTTPATETRRRSTTSRVLVSRGTFFGSGKSVLRFQGGVYHAPRVGGGTTGGNLVNNQPANRTFSIDFGNINNLAALTGTALTRPSALNAVEQGITHAVDLQLHVWDSAGHRLPDGDGSQLRRIVCSSPGPTHQHQRRA
jgi:hypothetical protein